MFASVRMLQISLKGRRLGFPGGPSIKYLSARSDYHLNMFIRHHPINTGNFLLIRSMHYQYTSEALLVDRRVKRFTFDSSGLFAQYARYKSPEYDKLFSSWQKTNAVVVFVAQRIPRLHSSRIFFFAVHKSKYNDSLFTILLLSIYANEISHYF